MSLIAAETWSSLDLLRHRGFPAKRMGMARGKCQLCPSGHLLGLAAVLFQMLNRKGQSPAGGAGVETRQKGKLHCAQQYLLRLFPHVNVLIYPTKMLIVIFTVNI